MGTFLRTKGLRLFGYNRINEHLVEVKIEHGNTIHWVPQSDGSVWLVDPEMEKCMIDGRYQYFEALNYENAHKRVDKYKNGLVPELCNLRRPNPEGINIFNTL